MNKRAIPVFLLALTAILHARDLDLGARVQPLPTANRFSEDGYFVWCGAPVKGPDGKYHLFPFADGSMSKSRIERPFVLIENDEPTYLFGAADGYLKNGKISTNVQFPIAPAK